MKFNSIKISLIALACVVSLSSSNAYSETIPANTNDPSYRLGSNDRDSWESLYGSYYGSTREGANWWASNRSLQNHPACEDVWNGDYEWLNGCRSARQQLTRSDFMRKSDPQYWNGWNKKLPFQPGIPGENIPPPQIIVVPAPPPAVEVLPTSKEGLLAYCKRVATGITGGSFDAYYDSSTEKFHTLGDGATGFQWRKCMTQHNISLGVNEVED